VKAKGELEVLAKAYRKAQPEIFKKKEIGKRV
jgi:hypothetical protein